MAIDIFPETNDVVDAAKTQDVYDALPDHVISGFTLIYDGAGLDIDVQVGTALINGKRVEIDTTTSVSLAASATNYIFVGDDGTVSTNATGEAPADSILVGLVETDASDVTVSRNFAPVVKKGNGRTFTAIEVTTTAAGPGINEKTRFIFDASVGNTMVVAEVLVFAGGVDSYERAYLYLQVDGTGFGSNTVNVAESNDTRIGITATHKGSGAIFYIDVQNTSSGGWGGVENVIVVRLHAGHVVTFRGVAKA